jgi:hypothetical protein
VRKVRKEEGWDKEEGEAGFEACGEHGWGGKLSDWLNAKRSSKYFEERGRILGDRTGTVLKHFFNLKKII